MIQATLFHTNFPENNILVAFLFGVLFIVSSRDSDFLANYCRPELTYLKVLSSEMDPAEIRFIR